jgi:3-hydroxyisobutyrate dehydrogenase
MIVVICQRKAKRRRQRYMKGKVGFIGLGTMGMPMARNLIKAGFSVTVYNRTASRADRLVAEGALKAASPAAVAAGNAITITIVSDTPDVESVVLGSGGVLEGISADSVVIDMSTISPEATREMAGRLAEKGCHMLDAPVSGGEQGAIDATLSIMVGGDEAVLGRCLPVLQSLGKSVVYAGPSGMGQTFKLMNQILVAGNLNAVVEALIFGRGQGVDLRRAIDAVKGGAAGSWQLSNLGPRMLQRDFRPGFKVGLMKKDLNLVMQAAEAGRVPLPATALVQQMFRTLDSSESENGTQALVKALERLSGLEVTE